MKTFLLCLLAAAAIGSVSCIFIYNLAVFLSPPVTSGGHPVMPIAHVALSLMVSLLVAAGSFFAIYLRYRKN